ncbi:hypothetical protein KYG_19301, partial [Acidovorax sp. NO-1]
PGTVYNNVAARQTGMADFTHHWCYYPFYNIFPVSNFIVQ